MAVTWVTTPSAAPVYAAAKYTSSSGRSQNSPVTAMAKSKFDSRVNIADGNVVSSIVGDHATHSSVKNGLKVEHGVLSGIGMHVVAT